MYTSLIHSRPCMSRQYTPCTSHRLARCSLGCRCNSKCSYLLRKSLHWQDTGCTLTPCACHVARYIYQRHTPSTRLPRFALCLAGTCLLDNQHIAHQWHRCIYQQGIHCKVPQQVPSTPTLMRVYECVVCAYARTLVGDDACSCGNKKDHHFAKRKTRRRNSKLASFTIYLVTFAFRQVASSSFRGSESGARLTNTRTSSLEFSYRASSASLSPSAFVSHDACTVGYVLRCWWGC